MTLGAGLAVIEKMDGWRNEHCKPGLPKAFVAALAAAAADLAIG